MPRYIAFLRGVSPMNCKMPDLKHCFEAEGFGEVKTLLSSGNVVFDARTSTPLALAKCVEAAMAKRLDRTFYTIVRPIDALREIIDADPYAKFHLPDNAKRVVTFLREPVKAPIPLPPEIEGARILAVFGTKVFTAYLPIAKTPVFMALIEKTFGKNLTTRTWDTIKKCVAA